MNVDIFESNKLRTRLLGMTLDHKPSWVPHTLELKKSFVNKLCLFKKLRFLPRKMLQDFLFEGYFSQRYFLTMALFYEVPDATPII